MERDDVHFLLFVGLHPFNGILKGRIPVECCHIPITFEHFEHGRGGNGVLDKGVRGVECLCHVG